MTSLGHNVLTQNWKHHRDHSIFQNIHIEYFCTRTCQSAYLKYGWLFLWHLCNTLLRKGEYPTDVKKTHAQFFKQHHAVDLEINTLAPMRCGCNLKWVIFKCVPRIFSISCENATRPHCQLVSIGKGNSWCQCRPRSLSSYGITNPQWVNP